MKTKDEERKNNEENKVEQANLFFFPIPNVEESSSSCETQI